MIEDSLTPPKSALAPPSQTGLQPGSVLVFYAALVAAAVSWSLVRPDEVRVIPISWGIGLFSLFILLLNHRKQGLKWSEIGERRGVWILAFLIIPGLLMAGRYLVLRDIERLSNRPSFPVPGTLREWNPPPSETLVRLFGKPDRKRLTPAAGGGWWIPLINSEGGGPFCVWMKTQQRPDGRPTWYPGHLVQNNSSDEAVGKQPFPPDAWILQRQEIPGSLRLGGIGLAVCGLLLFMIIPNILLKFVSSRTPRPGPAPSAGARFIQLLGNLLLACFTIALLTYIALSGRWGWYGALAVILARLSLLQWPQPDSAPWKHLTLRASIPIFLPLALPWKRGRKLIYETRWPLGIGAVFGLTQSCFLMALDAQSLASVQPFLHFEWFPALVDFILLATLLTCTLSLPVSPGTYEKTSSPHRLAVLLSIVALVGAPTTFFSLRHTPVAPDIDRVRAKVEHEYETYLEKGTNLLHLFSQRSRHKDFRRDNRQRDAFQFDLEKAFWSQLRPKEASLLRVAAYKHSNGDWTWLLFRLANQQDGWTIGDPLIRTPNGQTHHNGTLVPIETAHRERFLEEFDIWNIEIRTEGESNPEIRQLRPRPPSEVPK